LRQQHLRGPVPHQIEQKVTGNCSALVMEHQSGLDSDMESLNSTPDTGKRKLDVIEEELKDVEESLSLKPNSKRIRSSSRPPVKG
jgi:hypothetical protein